MPTDNAPDLIDIFTSADMGADYTGYVSTSGPISNPEYSIDINPADTVTVPTTTTTTIPGQYFFSDEPIPFAVDDDGNTTFDFTFQPEQPIKFTKTEILISAPKFRRWPPPKDKTGYTAWFLAGGPYFLIKDNQTQTCAIEFPKAEYHEIQVKITDLKLGLITVTWNTTLTRDLELIEYRDIEILHIDEYAIERLKCSFSNGLLILTIPTKEKAIADAVFIPVVVTNED